MAGREREYVHVRRDVMRAMGSAREEKLAPLPIRPGKHMHLTV